MRSYFPRDIERAVLRALPIAVVYLPRLNITSANLYLAQRGLSMTLADFSSRLHGCVIAYRGKGLVIVDGLDTETEKRFSIAHEAAHFILHYLIPRQRAIKRLGIDILNVLDGMRPPTDSERIDSILAGVHIGVHSHLLTDEIFGLSYSQVESAECSADLLALELLAPNKDVISRLRSKPDPSNYQDRVKLIAELLQADFGLPTRLAEAAAPLFERAWKRPFSIKEWLE